MKHIKVIFYSRNNNTSITKLLTQKVNLLIQNHEILLYLTSYKNKHD